LIHAFIEFYLFGSIQKFIKLIIQYQTIEEDLFLILVLLVEVRAVNQFLVLSNLRFYMALDLDGKLEDFLLHRSPFQANLKIIWTIFRHIEAYKLILFILELIVLKFYFIDLNQGKTVNLIDKRVIISAYN
jgi:hypothetical protein